MHTVFKLQICLKYQMHISVRLHVNISLELNLSRVDSWHIPVQDKLYSESVEVDKNELSEIEHDIWWGPF